MRERITLFVIVFLLVTIGFYANAQTSVFFAFKKNISKAEISYKNHSYNEAIRFFKRALKSDSANIKVKSRIAECYKRLNNYEQSELWYSQVVKSKGASYAHQEYLAEMMLANGKVDSAFYWFKQSEKERIAKGIDPPKIYSPGALRKLYSDSLAVTIWPADFNSLDADFGATPYKSGLVFSSTRKESPTIIKRVNSRDGSLFPELFYTEKQNDSSYSIPVKFSSYFKDQILSGPLAFFDNGKKVIFSQSNKKSEESSGYQRLQLYYAELSDDKKSWINIEALPFNSAKYSISHPAYDEASKTLYFVSDMPGGLGDTDIYYAYFKNGKWSSPVNMGTPVNSRGKEMFPFIGKDSILYFSSNRHGGLGGLDIYKADLREQEVIVENMGYPLNSSKDDFSIAFNDKGTEGYFSTNRARGGGDDDIYFFKLNKNRFEGKVQDLLKGFSIKDAIVTVTEIESNKKDISIITGESGRFTFFLTTGKKYRLRISKGGYKVIETIVGSDNAEEVLIKMKYGLERVNKTFVNVKILNGNKLADSSRMEIYDPSADSVEVIMASSGEFQCEINADTVNVFIAESGGLYGIYKLIPIKRKRKGSSIMYIEIELGNLNLMNLKGKFISNEPYQCPEDVTLLFVNDWTLIETPIVPEDDWGFRLEVWDNIPYSVYILKGGEKILLQSFLPSKTKYLMLE